MKGSKGIHSITFILLIVGGLNWLIMALFGTGIGEWVGGGTLANVIYILVGLSALYELMIHKADCRLCNPGGGMGK